MALMSRVVLTWFLVLRYSASSKITSRQNGSAAWRQGIRDIVFALRHLHRRQVLLKGQVREAIHSLASLYSRPVRSWTTVKKRCAARSAARVSGVRLAKAAWT